MKQFQPAHENFACCANFLAKLQKRKRICFAFLILARLQLLHKTTPQRQPFSTTLCKTTIMTDFPGKQQQSMATKLFNKICAQAFALAHQLMHSKSSGDAPSLARLFSSLKLAPLLSKRKSNDSLLLLSTTFAEEVPCDEVELQPKQQRKKPKPMPAAKDWMSHQLMRDAAGNIVKCKPEFSHWFTTCVAAPNLGNKRLHLKFCHRSRVQHSSFLTLLGWVRESGAFERPTRQRRSGPVPLLLQWSCFCLAL